jgi:hypothetical protein
MIPPTIRLACPLSDEEQGICQDEPPLRADTIGRAMSKLDCLTLNVSSWDDSIVCGALRAAPHESAGGPHRHSPATPNMSADSGNAAQTVVREDRRS